MKKLRCAEYAWSVYEGRTAPTWGFFTPCKQTEDTAAPVVRGSRYVTTDDSSACSRPPATGGSPSHLGGFGTDFPHADDFFIEQHSVFSK